MRNDAADGDRKKWRHRWRAAQARIPGPPGDMTPGPARTGACWGCFKGATNAYEYFGTSDWSGCGMTRPTATAKCGGTDGGPPRRAFQAPAEILPPPRVKWARGGGARNGPQRFVRFSCHSVGWVSFLILYLVRLLFFSDRELLACGPIRVGLCLNGPSMNPLRPDICLHSYRPCRSQHPWCG